MSEKSHPAFCEKEAIINQMESNMNEIQVGMVEVSTTLKNFKDELTVWRGELKETNDQQFDLIREQHGKIEALSTDMATVKAKVLNGYGRKNGESIRKTLNSKTAPWWLVAIPVGGSFLFWLVNMAADLFEYLAHSLRGLLGSG